MKKTFATMMALALTVSAQVQAQEDGGLADLKADMMAAMVHQDSIDTASLMAVYDYECHTQDADGKAVTDRMKLCLLVGQHCTRSFPYRKFRKEREWAEGKKQFAADFLGLKAREYLGGYDFFNEEELPMLRSESYCMMPEVWTNYPDGKTTVAMEVDATGWGVWVKYADYDLAPGVRRVEKLPRALSGYWVRFVSSSACVASAALAYE